MSRHGLARAFGVLLAVTLVVPAVVRAQDPVRIGGAVKEPKSLFKPDPVYPPVARAANVEGAVILEAIIAKDGTVKEVRVLRSAPLFDEAAVTAVKQWKYTPTELSGVPVEVVMTVVVNFRLNGGVDATQEALLTQRLTINPADADAMIDLAKIYRSQGLQEAAARMLQRAADQVKSEAGSGLVASRAPGMPVRVGGAIAEPKRTKYVEPVYPAIAAQAKVTGQVILEATIGKDGHTKDVRVLRGNALFNDAALEAAKQWIYEPALLNGEPVEVRMTVVVNFPPGR